MDFKTLLQENGWIGAIIILLVQFVYNVWKEKHSEDRKILKKIQKDVNMSFAFLRIMSGDKYPEIVKQIIDEKVLRE